MLFIVILLSIVSVAWIVIVHGDIERNYSFIFVILILLKGTFCKNNQIIFLKKIYIKIKFISRFGSICVIKRRKKFKQFLRKHYIFTIYINSNQHLNNYIYNYKINI